MNPTRIRKVARSLTLLPTDHSPSAPDAELLTRFIDFHDERTFEQLVTRHLPAVRAVCRSVLHDPNDADDAVQATFLVLVRRASAIRDRVAIGAWLGRVAWRTANHLREENICRRSHTASLDPDAVPREDAPSAAQSEVALLLNEEIRRLPECYRLAVLTCYGAGVSTVEAAARLGWPKGTLLTRLAWARRRLRDRLGKRGVTLAGGFTVLLANRMGVADGAVLANRITASAVAAISGRSVEKEFVSERVSSLTEGVVRTMVGTKFKIAVGIGFLAVALLGLSLGRMTASPAEANEKKPVTASSAGVAKPGEAKPSPLAKPADDGDEPNGEAVAAAPGNELVVRRPVGSYTREIPGYGKMSVRFTDNRMYIIANVNVDGATFTIAADADYSLNRESMAYGIITGVDVTASGKVDEDAAGELALYANAANDMPFAFRIRADEDAVTIKDIRFGALGSPTFTSLIGELTGDDESLLLITGLMSGKYKADPNPEKNVPLPAGNPLPAPRKKSGGRSSVSN